MWSRSVGDTHVVELVGDLDIFTAEVLRTSLATATSAVPAQGLLVVDLDGVLFCGVRGLDIILRAAEAVPRLVLTRCPAPVGRLLDLLQVVREPHPMHGDPSAVEIRPRRPAVIPHAAAP